MDTNKFLRDLLTKQALKDDSKEVMALQAERVRVERLIRTKFKDCNPTIQYGGSIAKGTANLDSYDLDLPSYFGADDCPGDSLADIFDKMAKALEDEYYVERKTSALRLKKKGETEEHEDFRIDVVPGRFTDHTKTDAYLYLNGGGEKERLKTNLQTHIDHVRDSGFTDEIRLFKLWKVRNHLAVKTFVLELMVIKILTEGKYDEGLSQNVKYVWTKFRDEINFIKVEDPANPTGNDLTKLLTSAVKADLQAAAKLALKKIEDENGWAAVFGESVVRDESARAAAIVSPRVTVSDRPKPWCM